MLPYFWYLLKVIICSGILFGYYWMFLRNKIFHQYNRFYLLASMCLSLLLPLLKINFWQGPQQNQAVRVLRAVSVGDEYMNDIVISTKSHWSFEQLYPMVYWLVCLAFLFVLLRTLFIIRTLLKQYPIQQVEDVHFVNTTDDSTPFSFLKYIFWNNNIDINTTTGRQIFKHEVAHIQQKHTYDKLFMNITLIFCWCNPFFWLYRKELNMIHEFIADKKAVEDSDTASFAAMILQAAYPKQRFELTNNFFYSPIKRRLRMLTKIDNTRVSYFVRLMVLPLAVLVFAAFTFKAKKDIAHNQAKKENISLPANQSQTDTLPQKTSTPISINGKKVKNVSIIKEGVLLVEYEDGTSNKMMQEDADKAGIKLSTNGSEVIKSIPAEAVNKPLYVVDGEVKEKGFNPDAMKLNPGNILSVDVLKGDAATKKYGIKGKDGVIVITTNKNENVTVTANEITLSADKATMQNDKTDVTLVGNVNINGDLGDTPIYVDGKKVTENEFKAINAKQIESVSIKNGEESTNKVIYITLKKMMEPKIFLGKSSGGRISLKYLKAQDIMTVTSGYSFVSALIYFSGPGFKKGVKVYQANSNSLASLQQLIAECKGGDVMVFSDVFVKDENGNKIMISAPPAFQIFDEATEVVSISKVQLASDDKIFTQTETPAQFIGGETAWRDYLRKNLKVTTPVDSGAAGGKYLVIVKFIIHTDGSVSDITCEKDPGFGTGTEVKRLIRESSKKWTPAVQNGIKVNSYHKQPVTFLVEQ